MEGILNLKKELGTNLLREYRDFLALDSAFKYLAAMEIADKTAYAKKKKELCKEYLDLILKPADEVDLGELVKKAKVEIKKELKEFNSYNCYLNEVLVLKEVYSSNFNSLDLYPEKYNELSVLKDVTEAARNLGDSSQKVYGFFQYMNFVTPSRYTKARFKSKIVQALSLKSPDLETQEIFAYELVAYINGESTLNKSDRPAYCKTRIDKIRSFLAGEDNGVDEAYIDEVYADFVDRQLLIMSLINLIETSVSYQILASEESSEHRTYIENIATLTDEDYETMSEKHYMSLEKLSSDVKFAKFQKDLLKLNELFLVFELDYELLLREFLNRKSLIKSDDLLSPEDFADLLIDECTNNEGESKNIRRVRMRILLSELPITSFNLNDVIEEMENAFVSASERQINWFLSDLYEFLGQDK